MKLEPCSGCGRLVLHHKIANLVVKCDPTPLTDVSDVVRLLTSPNPPGLWMVEYNQQGQPTRLRGARPGEPGPVQEHRCTRVSGADAPSPVPGAVDAPKGREEPAQSLAGPSTPSLAPPTGRSSARGAARQGFDRREHPCNECGLQVLLDGPERYIAMELGATVMWSVHDTCTGGNR